MKLFIIFMTVILQHALCSCLTPSAFFLLYIMSWEHWKSGAMSSSVKCEPIFSSDNLSLELMARLRGFFSYGCSILSEALLKRM